MQDTLGDRIKRFEDVTRISLTPRMPLIIRVDGKSFHTYTKGMQPFDLNLRDAFIDSARAVAAEMQGFEVSYHQSDEVSFLLTDYATHETDCWFDYTLQKVATITASVMTANFNKRIADIFEANHREAPKKLAYFDARAFNVPKEDVANAFLWRCKDWERNSLNMYCMQFFSAKQLHKKNSSDRHEMLHGVGRNWAKDIAPYFRNGSFILKDRVEDDVPARYDAIATLIDPLIYKKSAAEPTVSDVIPLLKSLKEAIMRSDES